MTWQDRDFFKIPRITSLNAFRAIVEMLLLACMVLSLLVLANVVSFEPNVALKLYGVIAVVLLVRLFSSTMTPFGPASVVMLYSIISIFGAAIVRLFFGPIEALEKITSSPHLYLEHLADAFAVSTLGFGSYLVAWEITARKVIRSEVADITSVSKSIRESHFGAIYAVICTAVCYAFAAVLIIFTLRTGSVQVDYGVARDIQGSSSLIAILQRVFWVALATVGIIATKKDIIRIAPSVIVIGTILLLSGNRNDILYPLAIAFGSYVLVQQRLPKLPLVGAGLVLFSLNPWIAQNRRSWASAEELSWQPVEALLELGAQIRPLTAVMHLSENGLEFLAGSSILLPTLAILSAGIAFSAQDYISSGFHIPNLLSEQDHIGMGFSMVGEFWLNFGTFGVVAIYLGLGAIMSKWELTARKPLSLLSYAVFSLLLFYWARNSIQFNVVLLIYFTLIYLGARLLSAGRYAKVAVVGKMSPLEESD